MNNEQGILNYEFGAGSCRKYVGERDNIKNYSCKNDK
jgi:hypothetical protein